MADSTWRSSASMTPQEVAQEVSAHSDLTPIGEVHIYIYSVATGGCEVQLKLPESAQAGSPTASQNRSKILQVLHGELATAMDLTS